jgi:hypothetical protein
LVRQIIALYGWYAQSVLVTAVQTSLVKEKAPYGVLRKRTSTLCKQNSVVNHYSACEITAACYEILVFIYHGLHKFGNVRCFVLSQ